MTEKLALIALTIAISLCTAPSGFGDDDDRERAEFVRPGTALAKLMQEAENHPMHRLAAVTNTQTGQRIKSDIPPWLRAHYMRNHPEARTAARSNDPTGGFPLALDSLYVWMLLHQDLQPSPAKEAVAVQKVAVGQNVRISGANTSPMSESDIRINFKDPNQIIAGSNNIGNGRQAQFFSTDGGTSWGQTTLPLLPGDSLHSDPTVDWTSDSTAWATTIGISAGSTTLQMRSYKSSDGGATWAFDATFSGNQTSADKQMVWVDRAASSPFRDTIYAIWHNDQPAFVNRRTTGPMGAWQTPHQVSGAETTGTAIGSDITTNSAGDVFAVWPDTGSQQLWFVKSVDGGVTFSTPVAIAKTYGSFQIHVPAFAERGALIGASIAAFRDSMKNNVYVAWLDLSGEDACNTPDNEPLDNLNSPCKSRVWFVRSQDGGANWGTPAMVNPDPGLNDQFNHKMSIDPDTGILGIVYYATGVGPLRKKSNLFFQLWDPSTATWTKATKVTTAATDETTGTADSGNQYGDYNGLSAAKGLFFPSWTDRRDGMAEAIFTSRISVTNGAGGVPTVSFATE